MELLDAARVEAAMSDSVIGHRIDYRLETGSTMDDARDLARQGASEGVVVIAEQQGRGRGRFSRAWVSPPGLNLYMTLLLRPEPSQLPYMNMAAALAVHRTVSEASGLPTSVKWPNDVRIEGRKLSGILIETEFEGARLDHALVGIGINVNLDVTEYPEIAKTATSLRAATGREFDRNEVLLSALRNLDEWYGKVAAGESLSAAWAETLETLGKQVQLRWRDTVIEGLAESVDDSGSLVVLQGDGSTVSVVAGEVTSQV